MKLLNRIFLCQKRFVQKNILNKIETFCGLKKKFLSQKSKKEIFDCQRVIKEFVIDQYQSNKKSKAIHAQKTTIQYICISFFKYNASVLAKLNSDSLSDLVLSVFEILLFSFLCS